MKDPCMSQWRNACSKLKSQSGHIFQCKRHLSLSCLYLYPAMPPHHSPKEALVFHWKIFSKDLVISWIWSQSASQIQHIFWNNHLSKQPTKQQQTWGDNVEWEAIGGRLVPLFWKGSQVKGWWCVLMKNRDINHSIWVQVTMWDPKSKQTTSSLLNSKALVVQPGTLNSSFLLGFPIGCAYWLGLNSTHILDIWQQQLIST